MLGFQSCRAGGRPSQAGPVRFWDAGRAEPLGRAILSPAQRTPSHSSAVHRENRLHPNVRGPRWRLADVDAAGSAHDHRDGLGDRCRRHARDVPGHLGRGLAIAGLGQDGGDRLSKPVRGRLSWQQPHRGPTATARSATENWSAPCGSRTRGMPADKAAYVVPAPAWQTTTSTPDSSSEIGVNGSKATRVRSTSKSSATAEIPTVTRRSTSSATLSSISGDSASGPPYSVPKVSRTRGRSGSLRSVWEGVGAALSGA